MGASRDPQMISNVAKQPRQYLFYGNVMKRIQNHHRVLPESPIRKVNPSQAMIVFFHYNQGQRP